MTPKVGEKIINNLKFKSSQTIVSFISTINLTELKKMIKVKSKIVRAIPLPPISLKKGPIPICPPNKKIKNFFDKIGSTIEIKNEKLSINFWSTSGMMASYYDMLRVMSSWLIKKGINKKLADKYVAELFLALSQDALNKSSQGFKKLVADSQTPKGLNMQVLNELKKGKFFTKFTKALENVNKRVSK